MPLDPPVEELLHHVGYAMASHVMARASLSRGTGRYEEPLTADLADMLALFDPYAEFLRVRGSRSWLRVSVFDFHKAKESRTGADFALIVRGSFGRPRLPVRKLVLVQAKREDWGRGIYAASANHVAKATSMAGIVGLADSFFAYYHSNQVVGAVAAPWPAPPKFLYASPARFGNQHFFSTGVLYPTIPEGFLEQSLYRRHLLGAHGSYTLPPGYEWGIGVLGADYFIDPAGAVRNRNLPTIAHVLANGAAFGNFLVALAECTKGTARTVRELVQLLAALHHGPIGEGEAAFDPMFALLFEFASGGQDDDDAIPDPDDDVRGRFETLRQVPGGAVE